MNILVVDDSQTERSRLEMLLKQNGHSVVLAEDGVKALEAVNANKPDLILMDVNMPEMDGFAATRELKNNDETKDIPVVLVTSKDQKADRAWGTMLGAKDYITKPWADDDVMSVVNAI